MRRDERGIQRFTPEVRRKCVAGVWRQHGLAGQGDWSTERARQRARAKHHETNRRYRQESDRHQVVVAHDTPASLDARTDSLNTSEQALFERGEEFLSFNQGVRAIAFDGMCKENAGAH